MKYVNYDWDLQEDKIVIDSEIDINKLGWNVGDHFKIVNLNGKIVLAKVDPLVKFVKGYK